MRELSAIQSCAVPVTFDPLDKIMPIKRPLTEVREEVGPEEDVDAVDREVPESREKRKQPWPSSCVLPTLLIENSDRRSASRIRQERCAGNLQHHPSVHI